MRKENKIWGIKIKVVQSSTGRDRNQQSELNLKKKQRTKMTGKPNKRKL